MSETPALAAIFNLSGTTLALIIIGYGFVASVLPVWLLLAPRDYLSTFLKVGTIILLAIGVIIVRPDLQMPAVTNFVDGSGPGLGGQPVPVPVHHHRLRLGLRLARADRLRHDAEDDREREPDRLHRLWRHADGIVRRHHGDDRRLGAASRRLLRDEQFGRPHRHHRRSCGAGDLVLGLHGDARHADPDGADVGETSILSRTGGAPTLAVGMASILSSFLGGGAMMGIWYHFIILFEALFILTTVDAGTRVLRFMIQDFVGAVIPAFRDTKSWTNNVIGSALACVLWGYLLYAGVVDPYGGIWTMWPLFGAANQMLAAIALTLCTVVLFKMKRERYALVTVVPAVWLLVVHGHRGVGEGLPLRSGGRLPQPRGEVQRRAAAGQRYWRRPRRCDKMSRIVFNDYLDAGAGRAVRGDRPGGGGLRDRRSRKALGTPKSTAIEVGGARRRQGWPTS